MSLWDGIRDAVVIGRKDDEALHAQVLHEIESDIRRPGLWAKALSNSVGDGERAKAEYIKLRVKDLRDQRYVEGRLQDAIQKEARRSEDQRQLAIQEQSRILEKPRPDKESESTGWVVWIVGGAIVWAWLANKEPSTPVTSSSAPQIPITQPKVVEQPNAPAVPKLQVPVARNSKWKEPRDSETRQPCVPKPVMTDDEIRRCREN